VPIADTECLAIFVFDRDKVKQDGIHWRAFLPSPIERSFFRVDGLSDAEVERIGRTDAAANRQQQQLRGCARILADDVIARPPLQLREDEPPPRHGVIFNWPVGRLAQRTLAAELAGAQLGHLAFD
jgi:hypothetical protein